MARIIIIDGKEYKEYETKEKKRYIKQRDVVYLLIILLLVGVIVYQHKMIDNSIKCGAFVYKDRVFKLIPY